MEKFDLIVVGAGPAGSAAALLAARAGLSVLLLERGEYPGSKNVSGAAFYGSAILNEVIPNWWERAPTERPITRRTLSFVSPETSVSIDFRTAKFREPPYNGFTIMRPKFDRWFAGCAEEAGAFLLNSTVVDGLIEREGQVVGVRTRRAEGEIFGDIVVAADGANSFLAKQAGLQQELTADVMSLGVKEVLALPEEVIQERFQLGPGDGTAFEYVGDITDQVAGGGFLYTNRDSLALGVIGQLSSFAEHKIRPETLIERFKAHPSVAPLVKDAELREYSAHLIPEAGWKMMPQLSKAGMLVAGDAAAFCFATGLYLEGINYAMQSGFAAGEMAIAAHKAGDFSATSLARYKEFLDKRHVLSDFKRYKEAPALVNSPDVANLYPLMIAHGAEQLFTVDGQGKKKINQIARETLKAYDVSIWQLLRDLRKGGRSFGW